MAEKRIEGIRLQLKRGIASDWQKASEATTKFIPKKGEPIFYSDMNMLKIGDGENTPSDLPFLRASETFPAYEASTYNCNECVSAGVYPILGGINTPSNIGNGNLFVIANTNNCISQVFFAYGNTAEVEGKAFFRYCLNNTWADWQQISTSKHTHQITFTPSGNVSAPDIDLTLEKLEVIRDIVDGNASANFDVTASSKRLSFALDFTRTPTTVLKQEVLVGASAQLHNAPVFTGTKITADTTSALEN